MALGHNHCVTSLLILGKQKGLVILVDETLHNVQQTTARPTEHPITLDYIPLDAESERRLNELE